MLLERNSNLRSEIESQIRVARLTQFWGKLFTSTFYGVQCNHVFNCYQRMSNLYIFVKVKGQGAVQ